MKDHTTIPAHSSHSTRGVNVLVVDDEAVIRGPVSLCIESLGHRVVEAASADEALEAATHAQFDIALVDIRLGTADGLDLMMQLRALQPQMKVVIFTAYGSVHLAVRAMGRGAIDFLCKPFTPDQLSAAITRATELHSLEMSVGVPADRSGAAAAELDLATTSAFQKNAIMKARQVAVSSASALISGEAGTGKSVLARAIHGWSRNPEGPVLSVDCTAHSQAYISLEIFGDSLFGDQVITAERPALIDRCAGGTLIIASIDALAAQSQERLSKLVKAGHFFTIEGTLRRPRDVRIIGTTRSPEKLSPSLHAALAKDNLMLPPLRERPNDIPALSQRYLAYLRQRSGKSILGFSIDAIESLANYPWPGNLRELRAVVGELIESTTNPYIEREELPPAIQGFKPAPSHRPRAGEYVSLAELEAAHIRAIVSASPSLRAAAEVLGIDFQALYRRRKHYGLE